jgi:hypothetical protein
MFSLKLSFFTLESNFDSSHHFVAFVHFSVHCGSAKSDNWLHNECDEGSFHILIIIRFVVVFPFFCFLIKPVVTPKFLHHFFSFDSEFFCINFSEFCDSECPSEKSRTHSTGSHLRIDLKSFSHGSIFISGNDNIDVFNDS